MWEQPLCQAQLGAPLFDQLDSSVLKEEVVTGDSNIVTRRDTVNWPGIQCGGDFMHKGGTFNR